MTVKNGNAALKRTIGRPKGSRNRPKVADTRESPRDRFLRLATYRVQHVLYAIRLVGNLSAASYKYDDQDIKQMRAIIDDAVDTTFSRFTVSENKPFNFSFGKAASPRAEHVG